MSVRTIPGERFRDMGADVTYDRLNRAAFPAAIVEAETIGAREWVDGDMAALITPGAAGSFGSLTVGADAPVPAQDRFTILELGSSPANTPNSVQVMVAQAHAKCLFAGRVKHIDSGGGAMIAVVEITAFNLDTTAATVTAGTKLDYVIVRPPISPQPTAPAAALAVVPGKVWVANEPITAAALNAAANPSAALVPGSIGQVELNTASVLALAAAKAGRRASYTLVALLTVTTRAAATVGTVSVPGATVAGSIVRVVAQPAAPTPLFTGYVSAAGTVTLQARKNNLSNMTVPAGTILKVVVFQAT